MTEESATRKAAEVPTDIYVSANVIGRHIFDFFDLAANQGLLNEGEAVLGIFDCIILDGDGRRLGGLTLHDYAILTSQNLLTWGRGRSKDIIDKFPWADIALDKFGRRTPIEGVVKVLYKTRPLGNKRRIKIRPNHANGPIVSAEEKIRAATPPKGVSLYLDLMPAGDVRPCVEIMRYLMGVTNGTPSVDGFRTHFRDHILRSQDRLSHVSLWLQPFYVNAGNGMLVEADDEELVYRSVPRRYTGRAERKSPYMGSTKKQGVVSPYRGSSSTGQIKAARPQRLPGERDTRVGAASSNEGGRLAPTGAGGKQSYSGFSKLDDYDRRGAGRTPELVQPAAEARFMPAATLAPAPESRLERAAPPPPLPRPTAAVEPRPTASRSVAQLERQPRSRPLTPPVVERLVSEQAVLPNHPLAVPLILIIPKEALNVYNVSRLARGLWLQPQNLIRNITDLSETVGVLGEVANLLAIDGETRRLAMNRIKYAVDRGPLARNLILHYTVWPFIKPLIDLVAMPAGGAEAYNRVPVRPSTNIDEALDETVGDPDLPDMGVMTAGDTATQTRISRSGASRPVPPPPMPKAAPPPPPSTTIPAVPLPPKRQAIGDLDIGSTSAGTGSSQTIAAKDLQDEKKP